MKETKTHCIKCDKEITVTFSVDVKEVNCLEVECCEGKKNPTYEELVKKSIIDNMAD